MKKFKKLKTLILRHQHIVLTIVVIGVFLISGSLALLVRYRTEQNLAIAGKAKDSRTLVLSTQADKVLSTCKDASYRPTCYEEEIPKLMDNGLSLEQSFEVTRLVQDEDTAFTYCHVLGHKISAKETAKDPSLWKDVITRAPSGLCSNGAIHGAFQERFRTEFMNDEEIEQIKPELVDVCEPRAQWRPTGLEQASCYHALGHLLMYITSAEVNKSLALCDIVALKDEGRRDYRQLCYDGNFMQIFQPLEPDDFALIEGKQPKKSELAAYCRKFDGLPRASCWSEGWPLYRDEILISNGLVKHCSNPLLRASDVDRCYQALFYIVTAQLQFQDKAIENFCSALPEKRAGQCYANAASRMIETDYRNITKATELCQTAAGNAQDACFNELLLYSTYNFHTGSNEFNELCNGLPVEWKDKCLVGQGR